MVMAAQRGNSLGRKSCRAVQGSGLFVKAEAARRLKVFGKAVRRPLGQADW